MKMYVNYLWWIFMTKTKVDRYVNYPLKHIHENRPEWTGMQITSDAYSWSTITICFLLSSFFRLSPCWSPSDNRQIFCTFCRQRTAPIRTSWWALCNDTMSPGRTGKEKENTFCTAIHCCKIQIVAIKLAMTLSLSFVMTVMTYYILVFRPSVKLIYYIFALVSKFPSHLCLHWIFSDVYSFPDLYICHLLSLVYLQQPPVVIHF